MPSHLPSPLRHFVPALGLSWALLCGPVHAADDWTPMQAPGARDSVATWSRPLPGQAVKAFRGVTDAHVNAWAVLALLADTPNLATWVFQGRESAHPDGLPADHARIRFKGVWPADDRDVVIRTTVTQLADRSIVVDSRQVDGQPRNDCCVRIPMLHNVFRLVPLPGGWTRVEFETQIDLGGMVPAWLANLVSTKAPLLTLQNLQQQVRKPVYQIQSPTELPQQYHQGGLFTLPPEHLRAGS